MLEKLISEEEGEMIAVMAQLWKDVKLNTLEMKEKLRGQKMLQVMVFK